MLRRLRETGPVVLVPLAWVFAAAAHTGVLDERAVLIGHVVMDVLLAGFAATSWRDMLDHPVLRAWLGVIVVGLGLTLLGTFALATGDGVLPIVTVFGWMLAPAVALVYTGSVLPRNEAPLVYAVGGALSALGALAFLYSILTGAGLALVALVLAGLGQTAGIVNAVLQY